MDVKKGNTWSLTHHTIREIHVKTTMQAACDYYEPSSSPPESPGRLGPLSAEGHTVPPTGQSASLLFVLLRECRKLFPDLTPPRAPPGKWLAVKECNIREKNVTLQQIYWANKHPVSSSSGGAALVVAARYPYHQHHCVLLLIMTGYWCCSAGHRWLEGMKTLWVRRKSLTQGSAGSKQTPKQKQ